MAGKSSIMFQLAHDFSAMDSYLCQLTAAALGNWFQWGHDFSAMDSGKDSIFLYQGEESFNGATTFQPWIEKNVRRLNELYRKVSMGPRLFSHG